MERKNIIKTMEDFSNLYLQLNDKAVELVEQSKKDLLNVDSDDDHRLTLRIPKWLIDKVDEKRKERVGKISRNLWILELLENHLK